MKRKITLTARTILGLMFFVFGLNGFLNFIPAPPPTDPGVIQFMTGLMATKYFFPFLKGTEVVTGALLLLGRFVPLALIILSPVVLNIVLFHRLFAGGPPMDLFILLLLLTTAWGYRKSFQPILTAKSPLSD